MTLHEPTIEVLFESARGAREPTARDRARNRAALEARLGPLGSGSVAAFNGAAAAASGGMTAAASGGKAAAASGGKAAVPSSGMTAVPSVGEAAVAVVRAGQGGALSAAVLSSSVRWKLVSLGVFTATLGFLVGLGVGREARDSGLPNPLPAAAAPAVAVFPPSEVAALPLPPLVAAEPQTTTSALAPQKLARAPRHTSRTASQRPTPPRPATPAALGDSRFLRALRLLERAQRALDAGEAAFAMSLLDDLDAGFPRDLLAEERQMARVLGWCGLGDGARARSTAAGLLGANAGSIYAGRLERSCVSTDVSTEVSPGRAR